MVTVISKFPLFPRRKQMFRSAQQSCLLQLSHIIRQKKRIWRLCNRTDIHHMEQLKGHKHTRSHIKFFWGGPSNATSVLEVHWHRHCYHHISCVRDNAWEPVHCCATRRDPYNHTDIGQAVLVTGHQLWQTYSSVLSKRT